jgi:4-amino-4-deoxy-L-arabinose transferase-like glycosyltransferase
MVSRIGYSVAVHQQRFSDFEIMWNYAEATATGPFQLPGATGDYEAMVESRALPYLVPVAMLSGGRPIGYQLANAIASALCALLVYGIACRTVNRKAGLMAVWIIAFSPEPLMAAEIPTHDIPGALFGLVTVTLGCLLLRENLERGRRGTLLGLGLLLGISLWVTDFQRGTGPFILGALLLATLIGVVRTDARRSIWLFASAVLLPLVVTSFLKRTAFPQIVGHRATRETSLASWRWLAIHGNSESIGYFDLEGLTPVLRSLDEAELRALALARTASDIADAGSTRVRNYAKRIATLYRFGSQYHWYLDDSVDGRPWIPTALLDQENGKRLSSLLRGYSEGFRLVFLALALIAVIVLVLGHRPDPRLYLPALVLAAMSLALGLFGEAQPRYLFLAWFLLPIYIGWLLTGNGLPERWRPEAGGRLLEVAMAAILTGILTLALVPALRAGLRAGWPRLIRTGQLSYGGAAGAVGRYRTLLSGDSAAAATLQVPARGRLTAYAARAPHASPPCSTQLRVFLGQQPIGDARIDADTGVRVFRVDLPELPAETTSITVQSTLLRERGCPVLVWLLHRKD